MGERSTIRRRTANLYVCVHARKGSEARVQRRRRNVETNLERWAFAGRLIFLAPIVRSEPLGLMILSALALHKRRIEVTLHAISTAASAAATTGHHSHTYNEYIQRGPP